MSKIKYIDNKFRKESLLIIQKANEIISKYSAQGYNLTIRQLYYQFISGDLFPETWADKNTGSTNNEHSYKRLVAMISNARLAGLIDWTTIIDRSRSVNGFSSWDDIPGIIASCEDAYSLDRWNDQKEMLEVWVEKDALTDVIGKACNPYKVPFLSCKGYYSQSAMWRASQRIIRYRKPTTILHLGDHDPSGIDMTRDIKDRLFIFETKNVKVKRIALTPQQIKKYNPPPNPTKVTDSRAPKYIDQFGLECWELDALEPKILVDLITKHITKKIDTDILDEVKKDEKAGREKIRNISAEMSDRFENEDYEW